MRLSKLGEFKRRPQPAPQDEELRASRTTFLLPPVNGKRIMNTSTIISVSGGFLKFVGEALADVKRQDLSNVDAELLKLKRTMLAEKLEEFKASLDAATKQEKAKTEQDLISRGLANTTIRQSSLRVIENDAATQLDRAMREYNRAIEEIALMERKLEVQNRPAWWKKVLRWLRISPS